MKNTRNLPWWFWPLAVLGGVAAGFCFGMAALLLTLVFADLPATPVFWVGVVCGVVWWYAPFREFRDGHG